MNGEVKKILGIILIFIGIAGLFLPLIQGFLLIFLGLYLLENKTVNAFCQKQYEKCGKNMQKWMKKFRSSGIKDSRVDQFFSNPDFTNN